MPAAASPSPSTSTIELGQMTAMVPPATSTCSRATTPATAGAGPASAAVGAAPRRPATGRAEQRPGLVQERDVGVRPRHLLDRGGPLPVQEILLRRLQQPAAGERDQRPGPVEVVQELLGRE